MLMGCAKGIQATEASFSPISTDSLCLGVPQMPRSRDVAIFVLPPTTTDKINCFTPCACTWGNKPFRISTVGNISNNLRSYAPLRRHEILGKFCHTSAKPPCSCQRSLWMVDKHVQTLQPEDNNNNNMSSVSDRARTEPVQVTLFQYMWSQTIQPTALPMIPKNRYQHT